MKTLAVAALVLSTVFVAPVHAQTKPADSKATESNMQILRDKVKADKKLIIAANMQLTDAEAKAFWPVYDSYQKELEAINQRVGKIIAEYADAYNKKALTNELAKKLTDESLAIEAAETNLRKTYADKVTKAVSAVAAARYLQIENKIRAIIRYELASQIPLVP